MGKWGVILDAGSSGTRVHIYKWLDSRRARFSASAKDLESLPKLITTRSWTKKTHPGISTFGEKPTAVGNEHLLDLLKHALSIVPKKKVPETPIFLMATAGVRLLPERQRTILLSEICRYMQSTNTFTLPSCDVHVQAIRGETEGLYGWIAANYLLGGFDSPGNHAHGKGHHTYGFLDMGGASAQIAFVPNQTEARKHTNDLKLLRMRTINGDLTEYEVFVATWLGFGMHEARGRYVKALEDSVGIDSGIRELPDPCLPAGLILSMDGKVIDRAEVPATEHQYLLGQGLFAECLKKTYPLLDKDAPCEDEPCLLHGQHVPAIDFDVNHFVGVSEYWHTTHEIFDISNKDKSYDFSAYQNRVEEFCSRDWSDIENSVKALEWGKNVDEKTAMEVCFKASWLINILHSGIGIPRKGVEKMPTSNNRTNNELQHTKGKGFLDPFQAVHKIADTEVSWTLGKMVLYAAGQVEPRGDDLAVGFGSNVPYGTPGDFQYPGSSWNDTLGGSDDDDSDDAGYVSGLLGNVPRKSTASFVLLIFVFLFIGYIFRRRETRKRLLKKFGAIFRRGQRPGGPRKGGRGFFAGAGGKLFSRGFKHYERVLENGDVANDFELHDIDSDENELSDSSDVSRLARSTGMATPILSFTDQPFFEGTPNLAAGPYQSLGFGGPSAMDRSGLVIRTDSRERLTPNVSMLSAGRRSRAGSPTRGKSPLMIPFEED